MTGVLHMNILVTTGAEFINTKNLLSQLTKSTHLRSIKEELFAEGNLSAKNLLEIL